MYQLKYAVVIIASGMSGIQIYKHFSFSMKAYVVGTH